jgi:hypothetical protein
MLPAQVTFMPLPTYTTITLHAAHQADLDTTVGPWLGLGATCPTARPTVAPTAAKPPDEPLPLLPPVISGTPLVALHTAVVEFTPANNTAAAAAAVDPVTFIVTSSPQGITSTGFNSPITVPGLRAGVAYTFTVQAEIQDVSISKPSVGSVAVTPGCSAELSDAPCGNGSGVCVAANSSSSSDSGSGSVYAAQCLCYAGYTGKHCESALATGNTATSTNATATSATGTTAPAAVVRLTADDMPAEPCKEGRLCSYQITFRLLASAFPDQSATAGKLQLVAHHTNLVVHDNKLLAALCCQRYS